MSRPVSGLTRQRLDELTERLLRPAAGSRPHVRLVSVDGVRFVVKDYAHQATAFKRVLGMYLVWRERAALERAQGLPGVPRLGGTLGPCALVTEYVSGIEATSAPAECLDEQFFARLTELVEALHARGVVHGDLKKLENILVTPDGQPAVVDFTAAFVTGSNPVAALVFPWVWDDDLRAICKLKQRRAPHLLSAAEEAFLTERSGVERFFRWFRRYIRQVVKAHSRTRQERVSARL